MLSELQMGIKTLTLTARSRLIPDGSVDLGNRVHGTRERHGRSRAGSEHRIIVRHEAPALVYRLTQILRVDESSAILEPLHQFILTLSRDAHSPLPWKTTIGAWFTLIEVILAIVMRWRSFSCCSTLPASHQLRSQAIQETERIAAARLIMDRITGDLRTLRLESSSGRGFAGSSNSLQFVKTDVPSFSAWTGGALGRSSFPVTD